MQEHLVGSARLINPFFVLAKLIRRADTMGVSKVDGATFKEKAGELLTKVLAGDITIIDHNGKRAVLMPYSGPAPDFQLYPETDKLLRERLEAASPPMPTGKLLRRA